MERINVLNIIAANSIQNAHAALGTVKGAWRGIYRGTAGCIVAKRAIERISNRIYLVNGEALTYTVRNKKEIVEMLRINPKKIGRLIVDLDITGL